jgi:NAD(P)-dependent dehydrogenase (short-subunit alcohol dehydrogenase family)
MTEQQQTALIVGASRGLGLALTGELLARGWRVTGTVRGGASTPLHELADAVPDRLGIELVDMTSPSQIAGLRARLSDRSLDLLFVNGAITRGNLPAAEVTTEDFADIMITNALSPMRVIDALQELVPVTGTIGVMSSSQGSVSLNTTGGQDVYRASKSALNQLMRSHVARRPGDPRTFLLINPGHVQTELGGPNAPLSIEQAIPGIVDTIVARTGHGGLHFVDYRNEPVPW